MVALVLPVHENLSNDKRVESLLLPCLDEGSIPSWSTIYAILAAKPTSVGLAALGVLGGGFVLKNRGFRLVFLDKNL